MYVCKSYTSHEILNECPVFILSFSFWHFFFYFSFTYMHDVMWVCHAGQSFSKMCVLHANACDRADDSAGKYERHHSSMWNLGEKKNVLYGLMWPTYLWSGMLIGTQEYRKLRVQLPSFYFWNLLFSKYFIHQHFHSPAQFRTN